MKKKSLTKMFLTLVLAFAMSLSLMMPVSASDTRVITVEVDGVIVDFDGQQPINEGGTILVPVRGVFELMDFTPDWNRSTRTATLTSEDTVIIITIGEPTFTVNGEIFVAEPLPARLVDGRVMLPLRAVAEALGATPEWISATRTAHIHTQAAEESLNEEGHGITRGIWEDTMYISEYLNLRFVAPNDWIVATDDEIAEVMGIGAALIYGGIDDDFWDSVASFALVDMMVSGPFGNPSLQIIIERLEYPLANISAADYAQLLATDFELMLILDTRAYVAPGTTAIGDYDWHSVQIYTEMFNVTVVLTYFINVQDGFVRAILITHSDNMDVLGLILPRFSSLSEPVPPLPTPPPPAESMDTAVVGSWAWDIDQGYVYEFLADGTGRRGWYPDLETFTWFTEEADNHLVMHFGFRQESWTYTIIDDVITLDNRRNIGETYSYTRWEGDFVEFYIDFTDHPLIGTWTWDVDASYIMYSKRMVRA